MLNIKSRIVVTPGGERMQERDCAGVLKVSVMMDFFKVVVATRMLMIIF